MTPWQLAGWAVGVLLLGYLIYALLKPETLE
jgi:K+-transporting ATPase KdpF subunit